uniref:Uncharacterized protein n=1 Tax=Magallana gigas TaxID=29159 RepID=A0A8W8NN59_MAGGI|nr:uncharacterized protein LOC105345443 isoform X1 [Crassostrea gigas]
MEISQFHYGTILCLFAGCILTVPVLSAQFFALDNPCLEKFRLCSTSCRVSYMTGSLNCQFCVCDDPKYSIAWPEPTTPTPTTTTTPGPTTTLPPGQWIANNIVYTKLEHPCVEYYASCPLLCPKGTQALPNGTMCETCDCGGSITDLLGKRDFKEQFLVKPKLTTHRKKRRGHSPKQRTACFQFHFACPIFRCPDGMAFALAPNGCRECRCIPIETTTSTTIAPTTKTAVHSSFLQLYCQVEPSDCPTGCTVVDFRVSEWHCYHCHCPDQQFVALQNPCDQENYLCPNTCQVRHLVNHQNQTLSCEFCDCQLKGHIFNRHHKVRRQTSADCPFSCPGYCHQLRIQHPHPYTVFGRKKRQAGCSGQCSKCPYNNPVHTSPDTQSVPIYTEQPVPVTTKAPHMTVLTEDHCIPEYRETELLHRFCTDILRVNIHNTVCLYCRYRTSTNSTIIVPKSKIQDLLKETTTSSATTRPYTTQYSTISPTQEALTTQPTTILPTTTKTTTSTTTTPKPTTTSTERTTTATTTTTSTTTKAAVTTPPIPQCHTCDSVNCTDGDLQECNTGTEYCMNTLRQGGDGSRTITRRCVSENECFDKWWIVTADDPKCLSKQNTPTGKAGEPIECNFCCKGAGCNRLMRIPDSQLYTGQDHPSSGMGGIIQIG